ncbi:hypothetical protein HGRIS_014008 [Hohenbuehelia grisea]|uniref:Peptidase M43 pregnancy-associated plasma-A domain-containing protein n=1 Tax=Hohenbuehelia grisea TaxID=104357 RepID=A0ABR3JU79_9AGAR
MLFTTVIFLSLSAITSLAGPVKQLDHSIGCFTPTLTNARHARRAESLKPEELPQVGPRVKVHWHVIMRDKTATGGDIKDSLIASQMEILNSDFAPTGLSFELVNTTRTLNPEWFSVANNDPLEAWMKYDMVPASTYKPSELHIYTLDSPAKASWARVYAQKKPEHAWDGVVLMIDALPGPKSSGHHLTHEVGHWSGLYHPFERAKGEAPCSKDPTAGDGVADTPPQLAASHQCDRPAHSCGPENLPDATDNYMNYVPDECRKRFTPGQIDRMHRVLREARGIKVDSPVGVKAKSVPVTDGKTQTKTKTGGSDHVGGTGTSADSRAKPIQVTDDETHAKTGGNGLTSPQGEQQQWEALQYWEARRQWEQRQWEAQQRQDAQQRYEALHQART